MYNSIEQIKVFYPLQTWDNNQILWAIICFLAWIGIVLLIEFLGKKFSKK